MIMRRFLFALPLLTAGLAFGWFESTSTARTQQSLQAKPSPNSPQTAPINAPESSDVIATQTAAAKEAQSAPIAATQEQEKAAAAEQETQNAASLPRVHRNGGRRLQGLRSKQKRAKCVWTWW